MLKLAYATAIVAVLSVPAVADTMNARMLREMPTDSVTVTDWYKQSVYDPNDKKSARSRTCSLTSRGR